MTEIKIPDIGDFKEVTVSEVCVIPGTFIKADETILILESDKASMDIPAPCSGMVDKILVSEGNTVSEGTTVIILKSVADKDDSTGTNQPAASTSPSEAPDHTEILVIGGGPGGYTAAFRAADLGKRVTLVDPRATLGGVCLNVGCIPSKALLHLAKIKEEAAGAESAGIIFSEPRIDLDKIRAFKNGVITKLTDGLAGLAKRRKVRVVQGSATFVDAHSIEITGDSGVNALSFDNCIIAVGSSPITLPFLPDDPRIIDSTRALELQDFPQRMLVIGGGIIGLEMAQVYNAFGTSIEIAELADQIMPGIDADMVSPLKKRLDSTYAKVRTNTKVTAVELGDQLKVTFDNESGSEQAYFDKILVAVGRTPNGTSIEPEKAGVCIEGPGFIPVNSRMQTNISHIFAIGDVVGQPMLAHKATHEAKVAAEVACGEAEVFAPACIPSVAYTDPEVAWAGLTEAKAESDGIKYKKGLFPWIASGRALSMDRNDGLTKLLFDPDSGKLLGGGVTGPGAGELIAEIGLAIEMGADAEDIALTIHPHPTLSETVAFSAEAYMGTLTDL